VDFFQAGAAQHLGFMHPLRLLGVHMLKLLNLTRELPIE
jgi:hypothetical protein